MINLLLVIYFLSVIISYFLVRILLKIEPLFKGEGILLFLIFCPFGNVLISLAFLLIVICEYSCKGWLGKILEFLHLK